VIALVRPSPAAGAQGDRVDEVLALDDAV